MKVDPFEFLLERLRSGAVLHRSGCETERRTPYGSIVEIPEGAEGACDCGLREVAEHFEAVAAAQLGRALEAAREER